VSATRGDRSGGKRRGEVRRTVRDNGNNRNTSRRGDNNKKDSKPQQKDGNRFGRRGRNGPAATISQETVAMMRQLKDKIDKVTSLLPRGALSNISRRNNNGPRFGGKRDEPRNGGKQNTNKPRGGLKGGKGGDRRGGNVKKNDTRNNQKQQRRNDRPALGKRRSDGPKRVATSRLGGARNGGARTGGAARRQAATKNNGGDRPRRFGSGARGATSRATGRPNVSKLPNFKVRMN